MSLSNCQANNSPTGSTQCVFSIQKTRHSLENATSGRANAKEREMNLMDHLNDAKKVRGEIAEQLDRMVSMRHALDITELKRQRQTP